MNPLRVFIGFEPRQPVAYQVCAHSVWKNASRPVSITRLDLRLLPIKRRGLTSFTYSRFLVPYLSGFEGYSLFLDSDILVRSDVIELTKYCNGNTPARIVRGELRFEWASVMLFDNSACRKLTSEFVGDVSNKLYDWAWCSDPGELPREWNHLVGYDAPNPQAKIVHFTKGIPIWPETEKCEFAVEWHRYLTDSLGSVSHQELMGRSVHVKREVTNA